MMFVDPPQPGLPEGLSLQRKARLCYLLYRVRSAYAREDHTALYAALDLIGIEGFPQIRQALIDRMKARLLRDLALDSMPWANRDMELYTVN